MCVSPLSPAVCLCVCDEWEILSVWLPQSLSLCVCVLNGVGRAVGEGRRCCNVSEWVCHSVADWRRHTSVCCALCTTGRLSLNQRQTPHDGSHTDVPLCA